MHILFLGQQESLFVEVLGENAEEKRLKQSRHCDQMIGSEVSATALCPDFVAARLMGSGEIARNSKHVCVYMSFHCMYMSFHCMYVCTYIHVRMLDA